MDRREFLVRAGRGALAAGALGVAPGWAARIAAAAPSDAVLHELATSIHGAVVAPGDPAYAHARLVENTRFDGVHPRAIVFCATVADVQKTVTWARRHGIHIVPRSGGHSYGGYSTTTGVVVDVSRLSHVQVAADKRTAVIGAGAELIDVYSQLWQHGLTIPAGSCATVGIAGLALGGGVGFSSRKLGLTTDNLRRVKIVTADGAAVACDSSRHSELFWACRGGGGGNFGIATNLTFRVHPVSTVSTYTIEWPWSQAPHAVQAWQAFAPHAPDGLFSICDLLSTDASVPGAHAHIVSSGQYFGSESALLALLHPLTHTGTPLYVSIKTRTYLEAVLHWAGCSGESVTQCHASPRGTLARSTFAAKSDYVTAPLSATAIDKLVGAIDARQSNAQLGRGAILLDAYGGAINRVPKSATAFVHRDALYGCQYLSEWSPSASASRVATNTAWLRSLQAAMRPHVSGFAYQNYIDPDLTGWAHAYYGSNYPRLRAVKRKYDPHDVFHFAQSIRP